MPIQVYSFYIFDRHTECIYSKQWLAPSSSSSSSSSAAPVAPSASTTTATTPAAPAQQQQQQQTNGVRGGGGGSSSSSRAGDNAKLIFGTVFSLRNMVRKLGGDDDAFISYRTAQYKLHYYETPTSLRFALLTEPGALSMRNVLHQIYINLWVEYVVKNPLAPVEHKGGAGVHNEMFEMGLDKFIRGLM
ncbi:snare-like protein [Xylariaceae sp. FL0804]|nr:snare-like protein [Xylariaceae sp. FL0804]